MPDQFPRRTVRIGVFYDGYYFSHVSNYYFYHHERRSRISLTGLHAFLREEIAKREGVEGRYCQIVESHYFRGRLGAADERRWPQAWRAAREVLSLPCFPELTDDEVEAVAGAVRRAAQSL